MTSRAFSATIAAVIAAVWLFASSAVAGDQARAERPNVIVVMTDDQGYGEFSHNGNPYVETPHIDRMARQSVRLTDFHVSPMCTPTRGQLLSGLDAFRNGAVNVSSGRTLMRPDLQTMADVFGAAGYRTGIFGKWHLGDNYPFRPEDRGFDEAVWFPSSHINSVPDYWNNDYFDDTYIQNGQRTQHSGYCTDRFFDLAMQWIGGGDRQQPFFAYVPLNAAHFPWFVPEKYRTRVKDMLADKPEAFASLKNRPQRQSDLLSFLAMGANIDDNVGRLTRFLDQSGLAENTIVVFLTDNGSTFGPEYFNAGMKGRKTQLWEGGHRVPCLIRWPGQLAPRPLDGLTQVQDLLPTLAELAGVSAHLPANLDGISLAPMLRDASQAVPDRMLIINYSRMPQFNVSYTDANPSIPRRDGAAVLWKRWRFLENRRLYHLDDDPLQENDVADEHPEVVAKLRSHLNRWWDDVKEVAREPQRVVIGHDAENPMLLTACEWLDVFVDQQLQIRRGVKKNGRWHLIVDRPGQYEFELRRWPRESGLGLAEGAPATTVTDGRYPAGEAFPIEAARLKIGDTDVTRAADDDGQAVTVRVELRAGPTELQTWLLDAAGEEICGAYYVDVHRRP